MLFYSYTNTNMSDSYEDDNEDGPYYDNTEKLDYCEKLEISKEIVDKLRSYAWSNGLDMLMSNKSAENMVQFIY